MTPKPGQRKDDEEYEQEHVNLKGHNDPRCQKWGACRALVSSKDKECQACCQANGREVRIIHYREGLYLKQRDFKL
jgi:hypothetical protein